MANATLEDMIERVQDELDLQDEDFITAAEITRYLNRGVNRAEAIILGINEDYLLAKPETLTLVSGTSEYVLPSTIYAQKIRKVLYNNGNKKRIIRRLKKLEDTILLEGNDDYWYLVTNDPTNGFRMTLYPEPQEDGAVIQIWFLRNVNKLVNPTDVLDLPEAEDFVVQFAKDACANKESLSPNADDSAALKNEANLLVESLSTRAPDEDNEIDPDTSFYEEHS